MNSNNTTVSTPNPPSMASKIARASASYSKRANHVLGPGMRGGIAGALGAGAAGGIVGGALGAGAAGVKTMKGRISGGHTRISPEAAREMLKENQGKLGALMAGFIQNQAGPVKPQQ